MGTIKEDFVKAFQKVQEQNTPLGRQKATKRFESIQNRLKTVAATGSGGDPDLAAEANNFIEEAIETLAEAHFEQSAWKATHTLLLRAGWAIKRL